MTDGHADPTLHAIAQLLADRAGIAPALLTAPSIAAIVAHRARSLGVGIDRYRALVDSDDAELVRLASQVSVPETWLFRYSASFECLRDRLAMLRADGQPRLQVASLGCASGAEPWSVAACAFSAGWPTGSVTVHALDRSADALAALSEHPPPRSILREELPRWATPWITAEDGIPHISPEVRACVRPQCVDFVSAMPDLPAPLAVVLCRNVIIYLSPERRGALRQRLVELAGDSGLIMLGHADGMNTDGLMEAHGPHAAFAWRRRPAVAEVARRPPARRPAATAPEPPPRAASAVPQHAAPARPDPHAAAAVRQLVAAGELQRAHRLAEDALRASPADLDLLELIAGVLAAQDRPREAHEAYRRLVYLEPRHGPALLALAELSLSLGDAAEAERYRRRASRVND